MNLHLLNMLLSMLQAGVSGGTGSGAAPVVAELARQQGALTIAMAMLPDQHQHQAEQVCNFPPYMCFIDFTAGYPQCMLKPNMFTCFVVIFAAALCGITARRLHDSHRMMTWLNFEQRHCGYVQVLQKLQAASDTAVAICNQSKLSHGSGPSTEQGLLTFLVQGVADLLTVSMMSNGSRSFPHTMQLLVMHYALCTSSLWVCKR
jgi:hypothetical protein